MLRPAFLASAVLSVALCTARAADAQIDARMFRYPDVSATRIAFVYAGDIWVVDKTGGIATRLSSPAGEEMFPRFSPDGSTIAYSADYDGNIDVYVVPSLGGDPVRLTHHPMGDRVIDWHPDGTRVLFASARESGRQRYNQFYLVPVAGGLPEKLPVAYGESATFSPDGSELAFVPQTQANRTWKRYRGGWTADIWRFALKSLDSKNVTANPANDEFPMWHGTTIYFQSDRGANSRNNIWAFDTTSGQTRQVTQFTDYDISFPSLGPNDIVFQAGGRLYLLDLATEKTTEVHVQVVTDRLTLKPRTESVDELIASAAISPTGKRAVFEARGDVFTVPAEHGPVMNLTRSSGVAERSPRWSPDGKTLAFWSDRSGEYELTLRPADGAGDDRKVTSLGPGYRYAPFWSPDSKRIAFVDEALRFHLHDLGKNTTVEIDKSPRFLSHGPLAGMVFRWSADSRWLTWARPLASGNFAVFVYDTRDGSRHQLTSGYFNDSRPVFDPEGKYLFYLSDRNFEPVYSDYDNSWAYPNATQIVAVPLRRDVPSPLAPKNDAEGKDDEKKDGDKKDDGKKDDGDEEKSGKDEAGGQGTGKASDEKKKGDGKDEGTKKPAAVTIDLEGFETRAVVLPPKAGNYGALFAVKGKLVYRRAPRTGSGETKNSAVLFDFDDREERTVLDEIDDVDASADGKKLLARKGDKFAIVDLKPGMKFDKPMRTGEMETTVDPRAEWRQLFADAFRFERDFFYDPAMHGVDWAAMRAHYGKLLEDAVTRWDVNFVLGEFIGELNASHTYRGGGDEEKPLTRSVGMLGVDWELANGAYRIKRIVRGGPWDAEERAPIAEPGLGIKEGDYVLRVNGVPLDIHKDPWAAFEGLAKQTVALTVNSTPSLAGSRQVIVKCTGDEIDVRFQEWIEQRREHVEQVTGGRVGYIYVQSTGVDAQNDLERQFMAQWRKDGLVIDERFNSGGQIPDRFIELLNRPVLSYWAVRHGEAWQWPPVAHRGPKVMLINGWSGSGGDAFPFYFREAKLGPLIGSRTWGGLIGISGAPSLVDGGQVTVPTFRMYDVRGEWFAEGHGVEPDIPVGEDPTALARGADPQLDRAIQEVMDRLKAAPAETTTPKPEDRFTPSKTDSN